MSFLRPDNYREQESLQPDYEKPVSAVPSKSIS
jgi:hypothetical protein